MYNHRRAFLIQSAAALIGTTTFPLVAGAQAEVDQTPADDPSRPRQKLDRVQAFVQAAHRDLQQVERMLDETPALLHANWDWGNGDWEDALEAASHMGRRDIVELLLESGARIKPATLAMLGEFDTITALIKATPKVCDSLGPHFLSLLFHAALSSHIPLAELVAANISGDKGWQFNQAMLGAARDSSGEMLEWLIDNGVTNINETNFFNQNPYDIAFERGDKSIIALLTSHGAVPAPKGRIE